MLGRKELRACRCVPDLIRVVDQVGVRAAARAPLVVHMPMAAMLLFWTILRDERTFPLICLEEMGVDMWRLTCDMDALIQQERTRAEGEETVAFGKSPAAARAAVEPYVRAWLTRAKREADILGDRHLGVEHLLLATVAEAEGPFAAVLEQHGLSYVRLCETIPTARLHHAPFTQVLEILDTFKPLGAGWDAPAVGVPRRYSLAMILGMTAVYAVLFAALRMIGTPTEGFILVTVFFTGVALGQPLLYGGRYPRAASVWIGAVLLPLETLAGIAYASWAVGRIGMPIAGAICLLTACVPLGAGFGYLTGCLAAGMFCVLDWYERRKDRAEPAEPASFDPFEKVE